MPQNLSQTQSAVQTQQQNTIQMALARLLELPVSEMEERVKDEMLDNEALEESDSNEESTESPEHDEASYSEDEELLNTTDWGLAIGDYRSEDDIPDYLKERAECMRDEHQFIQAATNTFYDDLQKQMGEHSLTEHETEVLNYLIGSLDNDGFLRKDLLTISDELAIYNNIFSDEKELQKLLSLLQTFEPRGIGARNLQECLHIQLTDPEHHSPWKRTALMVVDRCFKDFVARRWENIMQKLNIDEETLEHVRHELTHLNPAPGRAFGEPEGTVAPTVIPDFYVSILRDGTTEVSLNQGEIPEIRVSKAFKESVREYALHRDKLNRQQQETYVYARKKVDDAQAFITLIRRRKETLLAVMESIVELQRPFFDDDDETQLRPLSLKEVATHAGIDTSTVSRAVGSKYVQTAYGVYPLKFFFSTQFKTNDGEDISTRKVKAQLQQIIEEENKSNPLSDEVLANLLNEKGFPVARRTITKYREQMGIPVARLRKK